MRINKKISDGPSLFPEPRVTKRRRNIPAYDPNFFENFVLKIDGQVFEFEPWDDDQKETFLRQIKQVYTSVVTSREAIGTGRRFPYEQFQKDVKFAIKLFFPAANLKIDFDPKEELAKARDAESKKILEHEERKKNFMDKMNITPEMQNDPKLMRTLSSFVSTITGPRPDERLKADVVSKKIEILTKKQEQIIEKVFNHFFPDYTYNMGDSEEDQVWDKETIITQGEMFLSTLESSLNNLNKNQHV